MSAWVPHKDEEVDSLQFGRGSILRVVGTKALVRIVALDLAVEVDLSDLRPTTSSHPTSVRVVDAGLTVGHEPVASQLDAARLARFSLEALRFGLVPTTSIEELTIGFDELKVWTIDRLPESKANSPQVSEICGPFGTGKSHTMAAIRHIAEADGYLTARVEVDGRSVSLAYPERLLFQLWSTLGAPEHRSATPLLDLCLKAIGAGHPAPRVAPTGIDRVHNNYASVKLLHRHNLIDEFGYELDAIMSSSDEFTAGQVQNRILRSGTISAFDLTVKRMIGRDVADRPYDFVEALVGYTIVSRLAGFKGLVITVDEFEVEHLLSTGMFQRVSSLLDALARYLEGTLGHAPVPLAIFFATVGLEGHRGDDAVDNLLERGKGSYYELKPWTREERAQLAARIHQQYARAYDADLRYDDGLVEAVERQAELDGSSEDGIIRSFIKQYVAALDSEYGPRAGLSE